MHLGGANQFVGILGVRKDLASVLADYTSSVTKHNQF